MANQKQAAKEQHDMIGVSGAAGSNTTTHPDAQWFGEAGLGLFLHWGIAAVSGKVDLSWGMIAGTTFDAEQQGRNKLSPKEYYALAERFHPQQYDPEKWLKAAADAGFRYAVLTTKHHDGYSLWPSEAGELGVKKYLPGVDLVRPFVEGCRKTGLKVGLYYSPPDWYLSRETMSFHYGSRSEKFPDRPHYDMEHKPIDQLKPRTPELEEEIRLFNRTQIIELLTNYGKIDLIWFDGHNDAMPITIEEIRALQPGIVINPRLHEKADYVTPECSMPTEKPEGWWELCHILNRGAWGYLATEDYHPLPWLLDLLCRTRAWDGNLLINCAPNADGEMPAVYYERMGELRDWLRVNGEAVFGGKDGGYPKRANLPCVDKGEATYCFILPERESTLRLLREQTPKTVELLGAPEKKLTASRENGMVCVELPENLGADTVSVLKITWESK